MDTLDNANSNNPFALNSADIILQKEGFLLDLGKQNGDAKTNGQRSTDEEFDEDDEYGPETDVDAIDDVLMSPDIAKKHVEMKEEEKATLETHEGFTKAPPLEEAATPPADSVQDTSGLVDNVAESCEDSDDEWNYFKGDLADKENVPPSETDKEVCDIIDNDEMSHLNPNAAEFVPSSPILRTDSPVIQALKDDIIAQSPKKVSKTQEIKVPNEKDFQCEIKSRPSDAHENVDNLSTEEIMVNLLNGRNLDDIEFRPNSTPKKTFKADEFHFGPNASVFATPKFDTSEALSTKAVFGDESTASYLEKGFDSSYACSEVSKLPGGNSDPMSTSFYHDKGDDNNPFDLNKVHELPDNIEDFLNNDKDNSLLNETISDLPEHNPAVELEIDNGPIVVVATERVGSEQVSERKTPVSQVEEFLVQERESILQQNAIPQNLIGVSKSPEPSRILDVDEASTTSVSPISSQSPIPPQSLIIPEIPVQSLIPNLLVGHSPTPPQSPAQSPLLSHSPVPEHPHSTISDEIIDNVFKSPEPLSCLKDEIVSQIPEPLNPIPIVPSHEIESPLEDVTSSVKDSPLLSSPIGKIEDNLVEVTDLVDFIQETSKIETDLLQKPLLNEVSSSETDFVQEPLNRSLLSEFSSPESKVETESVATTDVNSFLERSLLPDVASPLSPNEQDTVIPEQDTIIADTTSINETQLHSLVLKSDIIAPEFPVQQKITTPSEEPTKKITEKKPLPGKPKTTALAATKKAPPKASPILKTTAKPLKAATAPPKAAPLPAKAPLKTATKTTPAVASPKPATKVSKAPLTNGVAKASPVTNVGKSATNVTAKPSAPRPAARPATAPAAGSVKPPVRQAAVTATARPATLATKVTGTTTTVRKTTTVTATVTNTKITAKSTLATSPKEAPKPRPPTAPSALGRTKPATTTKPAPPKTLDAEKSLKEAANKQVASRTTAATKITARKVEPKVPTTKTTLNKTSITSTKGPNDLKKPQELIRNTAASKTKITKMTTTTKEAQVHENGVANVIIENSQILD